MANQYNTPILLLVFHRPDTTKQIFEQIRLLRPAKLFIGCDGARTNVENENNKVNEVRRIFNNIDWDCEVKTLFQEHNRGNRVAVTSAINWFFLNVENGIILEHDCLPNQSFFYYCQELLNYYKDNERIMHISGDCYNAIKNRATYYFSKYPFSWGWATWRRAWKNYDVDMKNFPQFLQSNKIKDIFKTEAEKNYWLQILRKTYDKKIDCWDYQWYYTIWNNNGLAILPNVNLVSNIGYGPNGTNALDPKDKRANLKTAAIDKIIHSDSIGLKNKQDELLFFSIFCKENYIKKFKRKLVKLLPKKIIRVIKNLQSR